MMKPKLSLAAAFLFAAAALAPAQSGATRPRRVNPAQPTPTPTPAAPARRTEPAAAGANTSATTPAAAPATSTTGRSGQAGTATPAASGTARAFSLYQQKQYDAALREARQITVSDPQNSDGWRVAGFAGLALKKYDEAVSDLRRALELQRAAGPEDPGTSDALARAYVLSEKYEQALPLLVAATTRAGATPDANTLYYRGLAEFRTDKKAEAERSFGAAAKADPRHAPSLFYLGRFAFERKEYDAAIAALNRTTLADARLAEAWTLLTYAYLNRAAAATGPKADADYLSAVRASESLVKLRPDEDATALHAQALIRAKQYLRAATALERVAAAPDAQGTTLYLLGFAYTQTKNYPKAIAALERAAAKTPGDANVFRDLGYNYEASRQYAKALAAYEKGLALAPADAYLKESADRVRPFAQKP